MAKEKDDNRVPAPAADGVRRYGKWAGNEQGQPENPANCVVQIFPGGRGELHRQCAARRGHGPDGRYCARHDPARVARIARDLDAVRARKTAAQNAIKREGAALCRALGVHGAYVQMARDLDLVERLVVPFAEARKLVARLAALKEWSEG